MRSSTYRRIVAIILLVVSALVSYIFLHPLLVMHGPRSTQQKKTRQKVDGESATVVKIEPTTPPTQEPFPAFEPFYEDGVLKKQAFSSAIRLIFLVGLEGTGHHYMSGVLTNMCRTGKVPCPNLCPLAEVMYPTLANPKNEDDYKNARRKLLREMQKLAMQVKDLPVGKASIASFGSCPGIKNGMMSYPNYDGKYKALQHVDLKLFAEEAERAGIDLRIIYLTRAAKAILISDTIHNNYGETFIMEARVLLVNAAVMQSFFHEIDPAFTTCFRYENMTSSVQAERVSRFVSPTEYAAGRLTGFMLAGVKMPSPVSGNTRFRGRRAHRALGDKESWLRKDGVEREGVGSSAVAEDWRELRQRRALGEELTEAQEMVALRLQQKIDVMNGELCSW